MRFLKSHRMMVENVFILKEVKNTNLNKRKQEQSKTKANGHYIASFPVHGTGMSPYESDPPSLIPILDLATDDFMSIRHHYVGDNEEDTKEKTVCYVM